jgi:hypothetical protein
VTLLQSVPEKPSGRQLTLNWHVTCQSSLCFASLKQPYRMYVMEQNIKKVW